MPQNPSNQQKDQRNRTSSQHFCQQQERQWSRRKEFPSFRLRLLRGYRTRPNHQNHQCFQWSLDWFQSHHHLRRSNQGRGCWVQRQVWEQGLTLSAWVLHDCFSLICFLGSTYHEVTRRSWGCSSSCSSSPSSFSSFAIQRNQNQSRTFRLIASQPKRDRERV